MNEVIEVVELTTEDLAHLARMVQAHRAGEMEELTTEELEHVGGESAARKREDALQALVVRLVQAPRAGEMEELTTEELEHVGGGTGTAVFM